MAIGDRIERLLTQLKRRSVFLTPAGAGIAIISFFLPWVRVSCGTITVEASGARIGGIFWAVFAVAVAIFLAFFYFWRIRQLLKIRLAVITGAVFSLTVMLYRFFDAFGGEPSDIKFSDLGGALRYGAVGEFLGMLAAIWGMLFIERPASDKKRKLLRRFGFAQSQNRSEDSSSLPPKIP